MQPSALGTATTNATLRVDGNSNHALDFPEPMQSSPYGSYISSQNKTAATGLPLVLNPARGIGVNTTPGTAMDVNGAITNRETVLTVSGNNVTIPPNVSQVQLTGAATANVAISAQQLKCRPEADRFYNNTTGGFELHWMALPFPMVKHWNMFSVILLEIYRWGYCWSKLS